jgi:hypothetical protein
MPQRRRVELIRCVAVERRSVRRAYQGCPVRVAGVRKSVWQNAKRRRRVHQVSWQNTL